jgi:hypothetical protein
MSGAVLLLPCMCLPGMDRDYFTVTLLLVFNFVIILFLLGSSMPASNLAKIFGPTIVGHSRTDVESVSAWNVTKL